MSGKSGFGDRMKAYERRESGRRVLPLLPVLLRIDGRGFSRFCQGLERPYDPRLASLMVDTTRYLVQESGALCGYTQSDEISLLLYSEDRKTQIFFDGKIQKINSVLCSMTSAYFNHHKRVSMPDKAETLAVFDSRLWSVPTRDEAADSFLWRERDATKNSISMAARTFYSHDELLGKSANELQEMLFQKGVNWNDYPPGFKRGTFVQRQGDKVIAEIDTPPLDKVTNRVAFLFEGQAPTTAG
jgi:tRNA(His) guanylyltransferase